MQTSRTNINAASKIAKLVLGLAKSTLERLYPRFSTGPPHGDGYGPGLAEASIISGLVGAPG